MLYRFPHNCDFIQICLTRIGHTYPPIHIHIYIWNCSIHPVYYHITLWGLPHPFTFGPLSLFWLIPSFIWQTYSNRFMLPFLNLLFLSSPHLPSHMALYYMPRPCCAFFTVSFKVFTLLLALTITAKMSAYLIDSNGTA